jgi:hypothetical protein
MGDGGGVMAKAEAGTVYRAIDGRAFGTEQEADSHSAEVVVERIFPESADYSPTNIYFRMGFRNVLRNPDKRKALIDGLREMGVL